MQNDYVNKQVQSAADKAGEFTRSAVQQGADKAKDIAGDAQNMLKQGQEQLGKIVQEADKQVRENPWPILAGVAVISFFLGSVSASSKK